VLHFLCYIRAAWPPHPFFCVAQSLRGGERVGVGKQRKTKKNGGAGVDSLKFPATGAGGVVLFSRKISIFFFTFFPLPPGGGGGAPGAKGREKRGGIGLYL